MSYFDASLFIVSALILVELLILITHLVFEHLDNRRKKRQKDVMESTEKP